MYTVIRKLKDLCTRCEVHLFMTLLKSQYVQHIGKVEMCIELESVGDNGSKYSGDGDCDTVWW